MSETMHTLCCQIQIDRLLTITEDRITEICRNLSDRIVNLTYESGDDDGRYVNMLVDTEDAVAVWQAMQASLLSDKIIGQEIRAAAIVTMTGRNGWDDYLMLHHFDPMEPLDTLDNAGYFALPNLIMIVAWRFGKVLNPSQHQ